MTHRDYLYKAFLISKEANPNNIKPNPFVGALVVDVDGAIIGKGFHKKIGEEHAEVYAIQEALENKNDLTGTTLYVTLEPCSHFGKTPPCTNLIIEKKIGKVVFAMRDPNEAVHGIEILRKNGVEVLIDELESVKQLNQTFIINQKNKRPKYFIKVAQTIDGLVADRNGASQWLTNEKSRTYSHEHLRNRVDAILTTYKTVIRDNASFNIRLSKDLVKEQNVVVIDRDLNLLKDEYQLLNIFYQRKYSKVYLISDKNYDKILPDHVEILNTAFDENGVNIQELSKTLFCKNFYEILVEAGGKLNAALTQHNLIDELWLYVAPKLMNDTSALHSFNSQKESLISDIKKFNLIDVVKFDDDLLLQYQNQIEY